MINYFNEILSLISPHILNEKKILNNRKSIILIILLLHANRSIIIIIMDTKWKIIYIFKKKLISKFDPSVDKKS